MRESARQKFSVRKRVLLAASALVLTAVCFLWLRMPSDPLYKGRRLSAYLDETKVAPLVRVSAPSAYSPGLQPDRSEADRAVRTLGPLAVPLLLDWLQADVAIREKLRAVASKPGSNFKWLMKWDWVTSDPQALAFDALSRLIPEHGAPAIPILRKQVMASETRVSTEAAELLVRILQALPPEETCRRTEENADFIELATRVPPRRLTRGALRVMGALLEYGVPCDAERIVRRLWPYRFEAFSNARGAIALVDGDGFYRHLIYLESGTAGERDSAALFFKSRPRVPERVVPLLVSNLSVTGSISLLQDAAEALGAYGTNAAVAMPHIRALLTHPQAVVAGAASNTMVRIGPVKAAEG